NKPAKRMILYANHQSVAGRFRDYMGLQMADSSVLRMDRNYQASMQGSFGDTAVLEVRHRTALPETGLPREEVQVRFNPGTDEPYEVVQLHRSLVPVTRERYQQEGALPGWAGKTVAVGDSLFFLVKEQTVFFRYRRISHDATGRLPFTVSDRIAAEMPGKYRPVRTFADYVLTQQF
ncbi:MAG TPA: hypothetical protein VKQ52_15675, partial [Puia sp.]|nr:hypothetical protein [Puia sp.]